MSAGALRLPTAPGAPHWRILRPGQHEDPHDLSRMARLPAPLRPWARLAILDVSMWYGETSGGVRTYLQAKASWVARQADVRHVIVVPGAQDAIVDRDGTRTYRLKGPAVPTQRPYRFMLAVKTLPRIVAHERPDVVEIGSVLLEAWLASRAARDIGVPAVHFFHSNYPRAACPFPARAGLGRRALAAGLAAYARALDRRMACTVVASRWAADELRRAGIERIAHVPLGVDLARFTPRRRANRESTLARLGVRGDAPVAAYLGRFAVEKDLGVLVAAWGRVHDRTGARLLVVGGGPGEMALRRAAGAGVHVLAYERDRDRIADLLAAVDFLVAPGTMETFGLAACEALASGTPVLSADRGGVAEQVATSGGGRLFRAGDAASLARAAEQLLADDLGRLGARARIYAEREHDWGRSFALLRAVYEGVRRDGAYAASA